MSKSKLWNKKALRGCQEIERTFRIFEVSFAGLNILVVETAAGVAGGKLKLPSRRRCRRRRP